MCVRWGAGTKTFESRVTSLFRSVALNFVVCKPDSRGTSKDDVIELKGFRAWDTLKLTSCLWWKARTVCDDSLSHTSCQSYWNSPTVWIEALIAYNSSMDHWVFLVQCAGSGYQQSWPVSLGTGHLLFHSNFFSDHSWVKTNVSSITLMVRVY